MSYNYNPLLIVYTGGHIFTKGTTEDLLTFRTMKVKFTQLCRVEKTREQRERARGTLRDLPRNTQAQKQRIISPFIVGGKKDLQLTPQMNLTGTRQTYIKQRPRNKHK